MLYEYVSVCYTVYLCAKNRKNVGLVVREFDFAVGSTLASGFTDVVALARGRRRYLINQISHKIRQTSTT